MIKDITPELKDKIEGVMKSVTADINKSVQEDVAKVNNIIAESFKIPDNVLLCQDHRHAQKITKETQDLLEAECADLQKISIEVITYNAHSSRAN